MQRLPRPYDERNTRDVERLPPDIPIRGWWISSVLEGREDEQQQKQKELEGFTGSVCGGGTIRQCSRRIVTRRLCHEIRQQELRVATGKPSSQNSLEGAVLVESRDDSHAHVRRFQFPQH